MFDLFTFEVHNGKHHSEFISMQKTLLIICLLAFFTANAQNLQTPAEKTNFLRVTTYDELVEFINQLDESSDLLSVETIGKSVNGKNLFALKFSASTISTDESKIKVFIHAQQHGNEQSGKEGALLLAKELIKPAYANLFERIDLVIVPQVNPDGSEMNVRRNGNDADLNRNHLIMTEPEVVAMHQLFDKYLFEVTMDVHEYSPFDEEWMQMGYRKNTDILIGFNTNPDVSEKIRKFQKKKYLPFFTRFLSSQQITNGIYSPGGPPDNAYIRFSTFDINDGRQSYGIQNSVSFIQEGMNGEDDFVQNLNHRAQSQSAGMLALLEFVYQNKKQIKMIVQKERLKLMDGNDIEEVALQMEHSANGDKLRLPVYTYYSKSDSVITVNDFRPVVKPTLTLKKPVGYLIPTTQTELIDWVHRQRFTTIPLNNPEQFVFENIFISSIDSVDFEGDITAFPTIITSRIESQLNPDNYLFIPTAQLKGNMLVIALEPQSELGLATYKQFGFLMKAETMYPVIRVR